MPLTVRALTLLPPLQNGDLSPAIAAGIFLAAKQGVLQASLENMKTVMAVCILVGVGCNMLMRRELTHWVRAHAAFPGLPAAHWYHICHVTHGIEVARPLLRRLAGV